jgi:hypothetical protein
MSIICHQYICAQHNVSVLLSIFVSPMIDANIITSYHAKYLVAFEYVNT